MFYPYASMGLIDSTYIELPTERSIKRLMDEDIKIGVKASPGLFAYGIFEQVAKEFGGKFIARDALYLSLSASLAQIQHRVQFDPHWIQPLANDITEVFIRNARPYNPKVIKESVPDENELIFEEEKNVLQLTPRERKNSKEPHGILKKPSAKYGEELKCVISNNISLERELELLSSEMNRLISGHIPDDLRCYHSPERRSPGENYDDRKYLQHAKRLVFIQEPQIIAIQPMKIIDHACRVDTNEDLIKFVKYIRETDTFTGLIEMQKKRAYAFGLTVDGKHIILQQSFRSSIQACVGMLALDCSKQIEYEWLIAKSWNEPGVIEQFKRFGLGCKVSPLPEHNKGAVLERLIAEHGPGVLWVGLFCDKNGFGAGQVFSVVLDSISIELNEAVIRSPHQGRMLTVKADYLLVYVNATEFYQAEV